MPYKRDIFWVKLVCLAILKIFYPQLSQVKRKKACLPFSSSGLLAEHQKVGSGRHWRRVGCHVFQISLIRRVHGVLSVSYWQETNTSWSRSQCEVIIILDGAKLIRRALFSEEYLTVWKFTIHSMGLNRRIINYPSFILWVSAEKISTEWILDPLYLV